MLYLSYYGLKENPFHDTADPNLFWRGDGHSESIAILMHGIERAEGITSLTGDIGVGKTLLATYVAGLLNDKFKIAKINDSNLNSQEFLLYLADSFDLPNSFEDKKSFFWYIDEGYTKTRKRLLIIIDEAHRINKSLLDDLNLLAKIKRHSEQLIKILLVGQNPLIDLVKTIVPNAYNQKDSIVCHLRSLTKDEIGDYIKHRLKIAGTERNLFSLGAIGKIFQYSGGIPRLINSICDHALMIGYSTDLKEIKTSMIIETVEDLEIQNKVFEKAKDLTMETSGETIAKRAYRKTKQKLFKWALTPPSYL